MSKTAKQHTFFRNLQLLSDKAKTTIIHDKRNHPPAPCYNNPITEENKPSTIFIDVSPSKTFLQHFLVETAVGKVPNSLLIIFSSLSVIKEILCEKAYSPYLKNEQLKLWSTQEWEKLLNQECDHIRSPYLFNKSIIASKNNPIKEKVASIILTKRQQYFEYAEKCRHEASNYYKSDQFLQRIDQLLNGAPLKIYIERACSTVAVKRFSDECANTLKQLGCEVFIHPPCNGGKIDFLQAKNIELNQIKPDIQIRSPNNYNDQKTLRIEQEPPTLYPIQDLIPHYDFLVHCQNNLVRKEDLIFTLLRYLDREFIASGITEQQFIQNYLPIRKPEVRLEQETTNEKYDIGYAKTMGSLFSLEKELSTKKEKQQYIKKYEQKILHCTKQGETFSFSEAFSLGKEIAAFNKVFSFVHKQLSIYYIKSLLDTSLSLSLVGDGWEKALSTAQATYKGNIDKREDYFKSFTENRINLSINPWGRYHPRIFEGGAVGAFFLVFKMPIEHCVQEMPPELTPGVHFDYFSSKEELLEKCNYYLNQPKLRKEIGKNLKEIVLKKYSYHQFCKQLIEKFRASLKKISTNPTFRPDPTIF